MTKIYIGFSSPKKFKLGAKLIQLWQNQPYSHIYLRFESSKIQSSVYHAARGMVHFRSLENFKKENNIIKEYIIELLDEDRYKLLDHCISLCGEVYGYLELAQIFAFDICTFIGINIKFENLKGYVCSELVGQLCSDNFKIEFNKPINLIKPVDIDAELYCMELPCQ